MSGGIGVDLEGIRPVAIERVDGPTLLTGPGDCDREPSA